jgi:hypothetical protein
VPAINLTDRVKSIQYTGSNSAEGAPTFLSTSVVRVPVTTTGVLALSAARVLVTVT